MYVYVCIYNILLLEYKNYGNLVISFLKNIIQSSYLYIRKVLSFCDIDA